MAPFTDQLGNTISPTDPPKRIISLVPSQSELLWDLGLENELDGITRFCIHPLEMFKTVERVGGTKKLNLEKIISLKPDLIIGNREENDQEQIRALQSRFPVWMSDVITISDALSMITSVGEVCARIPQSNALA